MMKSSVSLFTSKPLEFGRMLTAAQLRDLNANHEAFDEVFAERRHSVIHSSFDFFVPLEFPDRWDVAPVMQQIMMRKGGVRDPKATFVKYYFKAPNSIMNPLDTSMWSTLDDSHGEVSDVFIERPFLAPVARPLPP